MCYIDRNDRRSERIILPLAIMYTSNTMTLLAWCCVRKAFRMFRLDRMGDVACTAKSFRPRRAVLLREYLEVLRRDGPGAGASGGRAHDRSPPAREASTRR